MSVAILAQGSLGDLPRVILQASPQLPAYFQMAVDDDESADSQATLQLPRGDGQMSQDEGSGQAAQGDQQHNGQAAQPEPSDSEYSDGQWSDEDSDDERQALLTLGLSETDIEEELRRKREFEYNRDDFEWVKHTRFQRTFYAPFKRAKVEEPEEPATADVSAADALSQQALPQQALSQQALPVETATAGVSAAVAPTEKFTNVKIEDCSDEEGSCAPWWTGMLERLEHEAPKFSPEARGQPSDWQGRGTWKQTKSQFPQQGQQSFKNSFAEIVDFLGKRVLADNCSCLTRFGHPVPRPGGWVSMRWLPFTKEVEQQTNADGWTRAWHGSNIEALYSVIYHGKLIVSRDRTRGERCFDDTPGVYVHKDGTQHKADNYITFARIAKDSHAFWAVKWEVRVDRGDRILKQTKGKTDQWMQKSSGSVQLVALWTCMRTPARLRPEDRVALEWHPTKEANPSDISDRFLEDDGTVATPGSASGAQPSVASSAPQ